jgi:ribosomal protein S27AE
MDSRDCPQCGPEVLFEQVTCVDGHGEACPERVCTECGTVLLVAPEPPAAGLQLEDLVAVGT